MPKHIILLMTDQLRTDYVGYQNGDLFVTPNIDAIAARAAFTCCNTTNPICTPARTSLITGRYTRQIGTLTMAGDLFYQIPTFMQALQGAGYRTYGIGKFHYLQPYPWSTPRGCGIDLVALEEETKKFGYDVIWETAGKQLMNTNYCFYCDYLAQKGLLEQVRDFAGACGGKNGDTADHNYDKALAWPFAEEDYIDVVTGRKACEQIQQHDPAQPMYLYASFCGPHKPYDAPQQYLDMFALEEDAVFIPSDGDFHLCVDEKRALLRQRRSVKAMMKLIDDQIGAIVQALREKDMLDDAMILFTSDHGDMLGDHYMLQKGVPWRGALQVPLAISAAGYPQGLSVCSPVELIDVAATILDYAGLDPCKALSKDWPAYQDRIPARSLLPILRQETDAVRDFAYSESDFTEERTPGTKTQEIYRKRGGTGRRSNEWRAITTSQSKYIKYLDYATPGSAYEEYYDLSIDPDETINCIAKPAYADAVCLARQQMEYIVDHYPAVQKTWVKTCAAARKQDN